MNNEPREPGLDQRVAQLERELAVLRQRVKTLEDARARAGDLPALEMSPLEMPALDEGRGTTQSRAAGVKMSAPLPGIAVPTPPPPPLRATPPPLPAEAFMPAPPPIPSPPASVPVPGARAAPEASPTVPSATEGPSPLRLLLERLQLWPPSGEDNMEARLGAWWATRLGTLLAVIGAVFLGVYVSRDSQPWVRFAELLGVAIGVSAFGLWIERKVERFGAVVFGGGLALLYFCAFGAYAVDAMKVIQSPIVAAFWQLAAVLVLSSAAVWRRSSVVATMAVALGFVTAIFSRGDGLPLLALGSALLLGVAAVFFDRRWRWQAPVFVAMPATYVVGMLVMFDLTLFRDPPPRGWIWLFLVGALTLYFARDWRGRDSTRGAVDLAERIFQGLNSTLAVACGVTIALDLYPEHLVEFYFGAAVVLGGLAYLRRTQVPGDAIGAVLVAKAAGAITLGIIELVEGRTTAIALLVQAWVMLYAASRMASRVLAVGTGVVAAVAYGFFVRDLTVPVSVMSLSAAGQVAFLVGLVLLTGEMARRLIRPDDARSWLLQAAGALLTGVLAVLVAGSWIESAWRPTWLTVLAVLLGSLVLVRRTWGPALAGTIPLAAANLALWNAAQFGSGGAVLWWNALVVVAVLVTGGVFVIRLRGAERLGSLAGLAGILGPVLWGLAGFGLEQVFFNQWSGAGALAASAAVACGVMLLVLRWPELRLEWVALAAAVFGVALWWRHGLTADPMPALVVAALLLWFAPILAQALPRVRAVVAADQSGPWLQTVFVAAATGVAVRTIDVTLAGSIVALAFALAALVAAALVWRPGLVRGLEASWVFWFFAWSRLDTSSWLVIGSFDRGVLCAVGAMAWLPVVAVARSSGVRGESLERWPWWRFAEPLQVVAAVLIAIRVAGIAFDGSGELWVLLAAVALAMGAARWGLSLVPHVGAIVLVGWAAIRATALAVTNAAEGWSAGLGTVLAVSAALVLLPVAFGRGTPRFAPDARRLLTQALGTAGLALSFFVLHEQHTELRAYITVGWGLLACAVFVVGLTARLRPHRLLGLVGLGLCVVRVFLVDLESTLHRIIAFAVLGVVLLLVGFSYQKFRHWIAEDPMPEPVKPDEDAPPKSEVQP